MASATAQGTATVQAPKDAPAVGGHWEVVRPPEGLARGDLPTSAWVIGAAGGLSAAIGLAFMVHWFLRTRRPVEAKAPASRSSYPRASRAPRSSR
jgi:hypothetical protein